MLTRHKTRQAYFRYSWDKIHGSCYSLISIHTLYFTVHNHPSSFNIKITHIGKWQDGQHIKLSFVHHGSHSQIPLVSPLFHLTFKLQFPLTILRSANNISACKPIFSRSLSTIRFACNTIYQPINFIPFPPSLTSHPSKPIYSQGSLRFPTTQLTWLRICWRSGVRFMSSSSRSAQVSRSLGEGCPRNDPLHVSQPKSRISGDKMITKRHLIWLICEMR